METDDLSPVEFQELDASFHRTIAATSGNELVALALDGARARSRGLCSTR
jgi:DNA-binding FadR family transcriptional regulator